MTDAEMICEAVNRPKMRFALIKTVEQQAILSAQVRKTKTQLLLCLMNLPLSGELGIVSSEFLSKIHQNSVIKLLRTGNKSKSTVVMIWILGRTNIIIYSTDAMPYAT